VLVVEFIGGIQMRLLSTLKNLVIPRGRKPRRILAGPFKGITMNLSLRHQAQVYLGLFEKEIHPWLKRLSEGLETAVDIGAAHGEYTLFFLMKTHTATVYAFEPDPSCLPLLDENLRLNGMAESQRLNISTKLVGDSQQQESIRLDSLVSSVGFPCLIKMDVDGAEEIILKGATALNSLPGIRWLIETHSTELEASCVKILSEAGFQTEIIRNAGWRTIVPELRPIPHNRWLAAWKSR
jgi:hypothetical protein